jgi:hypothetical protein
MSHNFFLTSTMKLTVALLALASASAFTTTSPFVNKAVKLSTRYVTSCNGLMLRWLDNERCRLFLVCRIGFKHADATIFRLLDTSASFLVKSLVISSNICFYSFLPSIVRSTWPSRSPMEAL